MSRNQKRMMRLLSAQQRAHSIASATAARARIAFTEADADQQQLLLNASGANDALPSGVVHALTNPAQRAQRLAELASQADRLGEIAAQEQRLARQLERLIERRTATEAAAAETRVLNEQLDAMSGRLMSSTTQVPSHKIKP